MPIQREYVFHCQTPECRDYTVLPHRSHLGTFDDQLDPSKGIWPITYLCQSCGHVSVVPAGMIRPEDIEAQARSPLVWYEFSNGLQHSLERFSIYSKESQPEYLDHLVWDRAVKTVLEPSGLWRDSYGKLAYVNVDPWLDQGGIVVRLTAPRH